MSDFLNQAKTGYHYSAPLPSLNDAVHKRDLNRKHRRQLGSTRWREMREKEIAMAKALGLA